MAIDRAVPKPDTSTVTSALASSSWRTQVAWPLSAENIKAVAPWLSTACTSACSSQQARPSALGTRLGSQPHLVCDRRVRLVLFPRALAQHAHEAIQAGINPTAGCSRPRLPHGARTHTPPKAPASGVRPTSAPGPPPSRSRTQHAHTAIQAGRRRSAGTWSHGTHARTWAARSSRRQASWPFCAE